MKKSVAATCYCRQCDLDQSDENYPSPHSFLSQEERESQLVNKQKLCLRSQAQSDAHSSEAGTFTSKTKRNDFLASIGVNTFEHAFINFPHFDHTLMVPQDPMHGEGEGILKLEIAALILCIVKRREWGVTLDDINNAMYRYKWPGGAANRPSYFTDGILKGTYPPSDSTLTGSIPKAGCHVHMTAGDTFRFALHSVEVLGPLIAGHWDDPIWQCWLLHVHYLSLIMQHSISATQISLLDELIFKHQEAFLAIDEYVWLYKPKHHFACHFPIDILNFGPPRHYWCMRFEAMNQVFKTIAVGGNYANTCGRCAIFWCRKTAQDRYEGTFRDWGKTRILQGSTFHYLRSQPDAWDHWYVAAVFASGYVASTQDYLQIEWVSSLWHHTGNTLKTDESWVHVTFSTDDGTAASVTAQLGSRSMMSIEGRLFFMLSIYPSPSADVDGMPTLSVPIEYEPDPLLIALDEVTAINPLKPHLTAQEGMLKYRFIPKY
jgi:hypothetical protein